MSAEPTTPRPKPSQVDINLRGATPFVDTFRKTEAEIAAGAYVAACVERGDRWQPIGPRQMGETLLRLESERVSWASFALRFGKFDVWRLIEIGAFAKDAEGGGGAIEPTEQFFTAVEKWVHS